MKLQKLDDLLLNLVVVFEAHKAVTLLQVAKQLVIHYKARENKRSHTDSMSPSLTGEGEMRK